LLRNVLTKAPQRLRARLAREVSNVFDAPSKAEAQKRVEVLKAGLGKQVPEAMKCLEDGFAAATQFYAFPREHWHRIRSTNGLERLHGEVKRRTRAVGAFPDRASALRPRHRRRAPGHRDLDRPPLPGNEPAGVEAADRQGCMTDVDRGGPGA